MGDYTPILFYYILGEKEAVSMMQGDSYNLGFTVLNNAKVPVTPNDIQDMEITIGHIRKTYRNAQITFYEGRWMFPISQKETFGYWPKATKAQIRILWKNGVVEGKPIHGIRINESTSKEVL
jgi:hypothetical protein